MQKESHAVETRRGGNLGESDLYTRVEKKENDRNRSGTASETASTTAGGTGSDWGVVAVKSPLHLMIGGHAPYGKPLCYTEGTI